MDQENSENSISTYDHFVGAKVYLSDEQGRKTMFPESLKLQRKVRVILEELNTPHVLHITYYTRFHFAMD